jgi:hypothetical protein
MDSVFEVLAKAIRRKKPDPNARFKKAARLLARHRYDRLHHLGKMTALLGGIENSSVLRKHDKHLAAYEKATRKELSAHRLLTGRPRSS